MLEMETRPGALSIIIYRARTRMRICARRIRIREFASATQEWVDAILDLFPRREICTDVIIGDM